MAISSRMRPLQTGLVVVAGIVFIGSASAPAFAADQTASRAPAARADNDQNQRVCVRAETTGRRIAPLVCRTRAEWKRSGELVGRD